MIGEKPAQLERKVEHPAGTVFHGQGLPGSTPSALEHAVPAHWPFPPDGRAREHVPGRSVTLTLPYPLSANRYWISFYAAALKRVVVGPSKEAKAYKKTVLGVATAMGITAPILGRVHIDLKLYPERPQDWKTRVRKLGPAWDDGVRCLDLDNARKVVYDSLKGVVFDDDKWVRSDTAERMEPDEHGARLILTVTPLSIATPQVALL